MLAAVSGGPDSVAMLHLLLGLRRKLGIELGVAHLNHGLRGGESDGDQRFVMELARKMGLAFHGARVNVRLLARRGGKSIETAAREARKDHLERTALRHGYHRIATGHTRSDQAETVLMHLIRGGGTKGLCGIPAKNGSFIRPLMGCGRGDIMSFLTRGRLPYRTDRTNSMTDAFRNRVRLELLPLMRKYNPRIEETLSRTAEALAGDHEALSQAAGEAAARCVTWGKSELSIDLQMLKGYNKGLQRNLIRWCCFRLLGPGRAPEFDATERALRLADTGRVGKRTPLGGGLWARREYLSLHLGRDVTLGEGPANGRLPLAIPGSVRWGKWAIRCSRLGSWKPGAKGAPPEIVYFDAAKLAGRKLEVGPVRPGLRMRLFGSGGTRKIQDVLVDDKVPRAERGQWPVVYAGDVPVWLAGIRRSDAAVVDRKTKKVLRMELKHEDR